jgi:hypothetical protein
MQETQARFAEEAADRAAVSAETHGEMMAQFDSKMNSLAVRLEGMATRETKLVQRLTHMTTEVITTRRFVTGAWYWRRPVQGPSTAQSRRKRTGRVRGCRSGLYWEIICRTGVALCCMGGNRA